MNVSIEVLKNKQNKYIICRIEVVPKDVFYFSGQERPHKTQRWLSPEQWTVYDDKLQELISKNRLNQLHKPLTYNLASSIHLSLTNSKVSKIHLLNTLNTKNISIADVSNVVDCRIKHQDDDDVSNGSCIISTPNKIEVDDSITSSDHKPQSHRDDDLFKNSSYDDLLLNTSTQISSQKSSSYDDLLLNTSTQISSQESQDNKFSAPIKLEPTEDIIEVSPSSSCSTQIVSSEKLCEQEISEASTESSDIAKRFLFSNAKVSPKKITNEEINKSNAVDDTLPKKHTFTDINANEKDNLDEVQASPPTETRKRKLYRSNEDVNNRHKEKEFDSKKHKLPETDKLSKKESSSHSNYSGSASKKKKSNRHRDRSKSPCTQEQRSMNEWLCKKNSKDGEKTSKSSQHSSSKRHASDGGKHKRAENHNGKSSSQKQQTSQHIKSKSIERSMSNEEKIEFTKKAELVAEADRKLLKSIKELLPKEPQKVPMLDLLDMSADEMLATFDEHRQELRNIFKLQKSQKKFSCLDGVNHFLVINLVSNKVQQKLMAKLSDFETCGEGTPQYGRLFSMVLMPEWILRIFMAKFNMSRKDAIKHITAQNEYNAFTSVSSKDLDKMASNI